MKAILLAGGRGERLRPLTLTLPKCLAPVLGRPLLDYWWPFCRRAGIDEVLINVSHHHDQVLDYLARRGDAVPRVTVVHETAPRGTAGTVLAERRFVEADESFWILYSDNLVELDVMDVLDLHARHDGPVTLGLFRTPDPRSSGIVTTAPDGRVTAFVEKPEHPVGDLANAGLYLARHSLLDELASTPMPPDGILDFGLHVFPRLVGRARAVPITGFLADVGSLERLAAAERAWQAHSHEGPRT